MTSIEFYKEKSRKTTHIGSIPQDWELLKLGDIGEIGVGKTPKDDFSNGGPINFITPSEISDAEFIIKTNKTLSEDDAKKIGRILPKETIVIVSTGSSVGKVGMVKQTSITNRHVSYLICNDKFHPDFIFQLLKYKKNIIKQYSDSSTIPYLRRSSLRNLIIAVPKYEEQVQISKIMALLEKHMYERLEELELFKQMKNHIGESLFDGLVRIKG